MIRVGFTGTRRGLTAAQADSLLDVLERLAETYPPLEVHHGCCHGADAAVSAWARGKLWRQHMHPGPESVVPHVLLTEGDAVYARKAYLARNHDIVAAADVLVAAPGEVRAERRRSGTWATVRHARKVGTPRIIVWPDGQIEQEGVE